MPKMILNKVLANLKKCFKIFYAIEICKKDKQIFLTHSRLKHKSIQNKAIIKQKRKKI